MRRSQISFFATKADLESLLQAIESEQPLQFVAAGLFESPSIEQLDSLLGAPDLGGVSGGDSNQESGYLAFVRGIPIEVRPVPQRRGGVKYAVDQLANPKTITFRPGGAFGNTCLIAGQVGTASNDPSSLELFQLFSKRTRHQFGKVRSYFVGKEAGELLDKGWRLTTNAKSPALYDLRRE